MFHQPSLPRCSSYGILPYFRFWFWWLGKRVWQQRMGCEKPHAFDAQGMSHQVLWCTTWFHHRQAETYQAVSTNETHGKSGPIKVSFAKSGCNVAEEFLAVAVAYDSQRGPIDDLNGLHACNGYGVSNFHTWGSADCWSQLSNLALGKERWVWCFLFCLFSYLHHRFIDGKTGRRSDTASTYLYPLLETNKNLTLLPRKRVVRVIFEYIYLVLICPSMLSLHQGETCDRGWICQRWGKTCGCSTAYTGCLCLPPNRHFSWCFWIACDPGKVSSNCWEDHLCRSTYQL